MKIAILGSNGFVGSNLSRYFSLDHEVVNVVRSTVDLIDPVDTRQFLEINNFDVIINAAAIMRDDIALTDTRNNLGIFMNLYNNSELFGKLINLGSGAEFDKTKNINQAVESDIFQVLPQDSYGFGQNIKSRLCYDKPNFRSIRIFNCFGFGETASRIFPTILKNETIKISNDRYFDYFCIQDLCKLVDHCIKYDWPISDINAVYLKKYKISQVVNMFCELNNLKRTINHVSDSDKNYTGNGHILDCLRLDLLGLEKGLENYLTGKI